MFRKAATVSVEDKIVDLESDDLIHEQVIKKKSTDNFERHPKIVMNRAASTRKPSSQQSSVSSRRQSLFVASDTMSNGGRLSKCTYA